MEDAYYDDLIESICSYLPNYQESLRNLIHNGYEIIGYARKSPTIDNIDTRTRLLQAMVDNYMNDHLPAKYMYPLAVTHPLHFLNEI
ncbi:hypothetical protein RMCBS344292_01590 [Rhizopus microsporus]|nr:hypothetical protein RMCBS344292_01590 [Rhizopus microsporus]